jgi:hypothetical protein
MVVGGFFRRFIIHINVTIYGFTPSCFLLHSLFLLKKMQLANHTHSKLRVFAKHSNVIETCVTGCLWSVVDFVRPHGNE